MLPLQLSKRAAKLSITDLGTTGERCLQGCQQRSPLGLLQGPGGMGNGDLLGVGENHLVGPVG